MAKAPVPKAEDSAEKAYAAAAEAAPVEFPSKARRKSKAKDPQPVVVAEAAPVEPAAPAEPETVVAEAVEPEPVIEAAPEPVPAEPAPVLAETAPKAKPLPRPRAAAKPRPMKVQPKPAVTKTVAPRKPAPAAPKSIGPKPVLNTKPKIAPITIPVISQSKDTTMASKASEFITDVKTKAKAAFEKGTSTVGDMTDFAKGNVEAVVESGKIYAAGLQELGSSYVAESKTAFETMTADVKELAAQKTPVDFFKLQSELAKKNIESAVAFGSKSSEAWMKLATEAFAPLSGRVTLAVDKIKAAA